MSNHKYVESPDSVTFPTWLYISTFGALMFLLSLAVLVSRFDLGFFTTVFAFVLAFLMASLVLGVFMRLILGSIFYGAILSGALAFVMCLVAIVTLDSSSRDWLDAQRANNLPRNEKVYEHERKNPGALQLRPGLKEADAGALIYTESRRNQ